MGVLKPERDLVGDAIVHEVVTLDDHVAVEQRLADVWLEDVQLSHLHVDEVEPVPRTADVEFLWRGSAVDRGDVVDAIDIGVTPAKAQRSFVDVHGDDADVRVTTRQSDGIVSFRAADVDDGPWISLDCQVYGAKDLKLVEAEQLDAGVAVVPRRLARNLHALERARQHLVALNLKDVLVERAHQIVKKMIDVLIDL